MAPTNLYLREILLKTIDNLDGTRSLAVALATRLDAANDSVNIGAIGGQAPILELSLLPSATRSSTYTGATQTNAGAKGVQIVLDITAVGGGADSVTFYFDEYDSVSGKWWAAFTGAALTTTGTYKYLIYPATGTNTGLTGTAQKPLGAKWRVRIGHSAATNFTYSIGGAYLL